MIMLKLIWCHCLADFFMQTDKVACKKSTDYRVMLQHCAIYTLPFIYWGWVVAVIIFVSHLLIDTISSHYTSYFHRKCNRSAFFKTIGIDQAAHLTVLWYLNEYIIGGQF